MSSSSDGFGQCDTVIQSNPDISGIGIRVSFYIQVICLSGLSVRSSSAVESGNALSSLVVTNLAYSVTTLTLGLNPHPSITLYDALVVIYLLLLSWLTIFISLPHYTRFKRSQSALKNLAILQSYLFFITGFIVLGTAPTFGNSKGDCNKQIRAVIFGSFGLVDHGRIPFLVFLALACVIYTGMLLLDYRGETFGEKGRRNHPGMLGDVLEGMTVRHGNDKDIDDLEDLDKEPESNPGPRPPGIAVSASSSSNGISQTRSRRRTGSTSKPRTPPKKFDGTVLVQLTFLLVIASLGIANTELVIKENKTTDDETDSPWTFGQILPLFLTVLPVWSLFNSFKTHKLGEKRRKKSKKKAPRSRRRNSEMTVVNGGSPV